MKYLLLTILVAATSGALARPGYQDIDEPPHNYRTRPLTDPFTRLKDNLESGRIPLDHSSEKAFVISLLKALNVPATSQLLVFSTTSLQLSLITPRSPRAVYFSEDLYVGYVQRGRIEIVSLDPEAGPIFYIFDISKDGRPPRAERAERCMNCHASEDTGHVPGLLVKSVMPGPRGGSLVAFRQEQSGHGIPFDQRFGGWYVTGKHGISDHQGNVIGQLSAGKLTRNAIEPGSLFDFGSYPVATSDILPHLLLEHQTGFVNRVVEASYRARTIAAETHGQPTGAQAEELNEQARILTRYLLFKDEVPLPPGGVEGDAAFKTDFLRGRRPARNGSSLKDFDLRTRLFKHRCSYMIYSTVFQALPTVMKQRVYRLLGDALNTAKPDEEYAYIPAAEKRAIHDILKATLRDLPVFW